MFLLTFLTIIFVVIECHVDIRCEFEAKEIVIHSDDAVVDFLSCVHLVNSTAHGGVEDGKLSPTPQPSPPSETKTMDIQGQNMDDASPVNHREVQPGEVRFGFVASCDGDKTLCSQAPPWFPWQTSLVDGGSVPVDANSFSQSPSAFLLFCFSSSEVRADDVVVVRFVSVSPTPRPSSFPNTLPDSTVAPPADVEKTKKPKSDDAGGSATSSSTAPSAGAPGSFSQRVDSRLVGATAGSVIVVGFGIGGWLVWLCMFRRRPESRSHEENVADNDLPASPRHQPTDWQNFPRSLSMSSSPRRKRILSPRSTSGGPHQRARLRVLSHSPPRGANTILPQEDDAAFAGSPSRSPRYNLGAKVSESSTPWWSLDNGPWADPSNAGYTQAQLSPLHPAFSSLNDEESIHSAMQHHQQQENEQRLEPRSILLSTPFATEAPLWPPAAFGPSHSVFQSAGAPPLIQPPPSEIQNRRSTLSWQKSLRRISPGLPDDVYSRWAAALLNEDLYEPSALNRLDFRTLDQLTSKLPAHLAATLRQWLITSRSVGEMAATSASPSAPEGQEPSATAAAVAPAAAVQPAPQSRHQFNATDSADSSGPPSSPPFLPSLASDTATATSASSSSGSGGGNGTSGPGGQGSSRSTTRSHVCPVCAKTFNRPAKLRQHMLAKHQSDSKPFACDHPNCNKKYTRQDNLNRHKKTHS